MKKLLLILVIVGAVVGVTVVQQDASSDEADVVTVFSVVTQPIESTVLATGTLTYGDERRVRAEINARVESVDVEEGDRVKKDQVLIHLEKDDFETDVNNQKTNVSLRRIDIERAQLQIESLNIQLARQETLFKQKAAQASTIEDLQNQIAQAEVNLKMQRQLLQQSQDHLKQAEKRLAKTVIRSPMDGMVSALDIKEGEMAVTGGNNISLLTLVDPDHIFTEVDVDEADIGSVQLDQPVRVFAVAYLDVPLEGTVTQIATSARQVPGKNSLVFPVDVVIEDQQGVVLRPGMSTRAEILNRSSVDYKVVPIEAIQESDEGEENVYQVFTVTDGIVTAVDVRLGPQDDRYQAVKDGLTDGDLIVSGPYRVVRSMKTGDKVTVESDDDSTD